VWLIFSKQLAERKVPDFKGQVQCVSMQFVIKKCFFLNLEKIIGADPFCHFEKIAKTAHFNCEKSRHRAED